MLLKVGSRGDDVKKLQSQLKILGYNLSIDGIYGSSTFNAVKDFQNKNKLSSDGIVGDKTWEKLFATAADKKPTSVLDGSHKLSSDFGMRIHPITKEQKMHNGVDLSGVPKGNAVRTPVDGLIKVAQFSISAGNYINVESGNTTYMFMHLDSMDVKPGQRVTKGQRIGGVGTTGASTGIHLHYEVRVNGKPIDPKPYIKF